MDQHAETELHNANWPEDSISESRRGAESRFRCYPSAKLTPLNDPEWEQEYRLTEISLTAIQLVADESPHLNELVCIELPDHLLLADVKHSVRRGNKFATDAARIVTIRKTAVLEGATKIAKIEALMADFHLQCEMQLSTIEASIANLDTQIGSQVTSIEPRPDSFVGRHLGSRAYPRLPLTSIESDLSQPQEQPPSSFYGLDVDRPDMLGHLLNDGTIAPPVPVNSTNASPNADASGALEHFGGIPLAPTHQENFDWPPPPCVVTLVGFDSPEPQPSDKPEDFDLRSITSNQKPLFGTAHRRPAIRPWVISVGLAAGLAILVWAIPLFGPSRDGVLMLRRLFVVESKAYTRSSATMAAQSESKRAMPPTPAYTAPSSVQHSLPSVPVAASGDTTLHASIKSTGVSWISACSDGKQLFENMLAPGDTREIEFSHRAVVRLGNGPVVDIKVDGKPVEPLGVSGVVRTIELGPGSSRFLPLNSRDGARACGNDQAAVYPAESRVAKR